MLEVALFYISSYSTVVVRGANVLSLSGLWFNPGSRVVLFNKAWVQSWCWLLNMCSREPGTSVPRPPWVSISVDFFASQQILDLEKFQHFDIFKILYYT